MCEWSRRWAAFRAASGPAGEIPRALQQIEELKIEHPLLGKPRSAGCGRSTDPSSACRSWKKCCVTWAVKLLLHLPSAIHARRFSGIRGHRNRLPVTGALPAQDHVDSERKDRRAVDRSSARRRPPSSETRQAWRDVGTTRNSIGSGSFGRLFISTTNSFSVRRRLQLEGVR